jgi:hypothetical protein
MGGTRIRPRTRGKYHRVPLLLAGLGSGISLLVLFFYSTHWEQRQSARKEWNGGVDAGRCSFDAEGVGEDATAMTRFALWAYQEGMVEAAGNCSLRALEVSLLPGSAGSLGLFSDARRFCTGTITWVPPYKTFLVPSPSCRSPLPLPPTLFSLSPWPQRKRSNLPHFSVS